MACGVVDIMMHTMDRYFNPSTDNNLTDELAEGLLRCTIQNGRLAVEQPRNLHAMGELMWAGSLSHNGLTGLGGAKDFAPHQLGHELSAMFDATHGATPVSYTHLDVYKRQVRCHPRGGRRHWNHQSAGDHHCLG